ncbi:proteasome assembly chaperone family protein [Salinigranum sp. GCM10025319]|uniref:proteasome assembly chaperone family protein n=1 Tax=Salinigranum sp. GCM10025319 TaxID=3252687 RepID=UPI003611B5CD
MTESTHTASDVQITHATEPSSTVLAGFSSFGLAGLTAVDFLVDHLDLEQQGHVSVEGLPAITPFTEGRPRHPARLYSRDDLDVTVLVVELFVPVSVGQAFAEAVLDWTEAGPVEEVAVLAGVPVPHGPDAHRTFYIATEDYHDRRLADEEIPPMGTGFLDGVNAALMARGLDSPLGVCVYVTPVHAQAPDVDAAIRLVESIEDVYGLGIDATPLAEFAERVRRYYADLAARMDDAETDVPEDRMYM